ncbi:hypothetical protein LguiB_001597 [Lonicera macranthoides]
MRCLASHLLLWRDMTTFSILENIVLKSLYDIVIAVSYIATEFAHCQSLKIPLRRLSLHIEEETVRAKIEIARGAGHVLVLPAKLAGLSTKKKRTKGIYKPYDSRGSDNWSDNTGKFLRIVTRGTTVSGLRRYGHKSPKEIVRARVSASELILAEKVKSQEEQLQVANERIRQLEGQYADIHEIVRQLKETRETVTGSNTSWR